MRPANHDLPFSGCFDDSDVDENSNTEEDEESDEEFKRNRR